MRTAGENRVAILSDAFCKRRFAGDSKVLGSSIELNGRPYEVISIMPEAFPFPKGNEVHPMVLVPECADLWLPLTVRPEETQRMVNQNYAAIEVRDFFRSVLSVPAALRLECMNSLPREIRQRDEMTAASEWYGLRRMFSEGRHGTTDSELIEELRRRNTCSE
jgi:hypothetical protein